MPLQIESWNDFVSVTEFCRNRFYREHRQGNFVTLTVLSGDYFYQEEFAMNDQDDKMVYDSIKEWCSNNAGILVIGSRPKELVFA